MDQAAFEQRFDIARFVLMRKYRWARRIIRNLTPHYRQGATLAVDRYYRLYYGEQTEQWTDQEFVGALWHEVNHLLRKHPDRLEHFLPILPKGMDPRTVNVAADLEINDDLAQQDGIKLPPGLFYSHSVGHLPGLLAETHLREFVEGYEEQDDAPQQYIFMDDDEDFEGDGEGIPMPMPGGRGDPDDDDEEDDDADNNDESPGGSGDDDDELDDDEDGGDGVNAPSQPQFADPPPQQNPNKSPEDTGLDMPECGSGAGVEDPEELPPPDDTEQARLKREERKLDEDIIDAVNEGGSSGLPPGMTPAMHNAAVNRLVPKIDWRQQLAVELRTAFEQRADEAEEYSFRRRSRRQASFPDAILPGTFRPIPNLGVVVDISGSMNGPKVVAAMTEVKGILERLSIPMFTVYPCDTEVQGEYTVETEADIARILDDAGGGTNMMVGLHYAADRGSEVIVCLTDMDCSWDEKWLNGIPVIIGAIDGRRAAPSWARVITVRSAAELDLDG
jgi:predicted metal-dependent peptidase